MDDFIVRVVDMPPQIRAFVRYDPDCIANIYVNARLDLPEQRRALRHELTHVRRGDCFRHFPIEELEMMT